MAEIRIRDYKLGNKLGSGSFGDIFVGKSIANDRDDVAIKLEHRDCKHPQLAWEYKIYKLLESEPDFPKVHWYGHVGEYIVLIVELLGHSLEHVHIECGFDIWAIRSIAVQMISRIESMHKNGYIHRDIKPDNFLVGRGSKKGTVFCIDYGLAKTFISRTGKHIAYKKGKHLTGTARYASINNHFGVELSRRDDLEAIGYVLVYLAKGFLPWQGLTCSTKTKRYEAIGKMKRDMKVSELAKGLPIGFCRYLEYARNMKFDEKPDYEYMRGLFLRQFEYDSEGVP